MAKTAEKSRYLVEVLVTVAIEVDETYREEDYGSVFNADRMENVYPDIQTRADVLRHWAYNAVANGVTDVSRLDGWACDPAEVVKIEVDEYDGDGMIFATGEDDDRYRLLDEVRREGTGRWADRG